MRKFFVRSGEKENGPFSASEIRKLIDSGQVDGEDLLREENKKTWHRVSSIRWNSSSSSPSSQADSSEPSPLPAEDESPRASQPCAKDPDAEAIEPSINSSDDNAVPKSTLIEDFFNESFRDTFSKNQQILLGDRLTQKKLEGIHSYATLRPTECIL